MSAKFNMDQLYETKLLHRKGFKKYLEYCKWLGPNCNPPPLPFEKWLAMEHKWGRL